MDAESVRPATQPAAMGGTAAVGSRLAAPAARRPPRVLVVLASAVTGTLWLLGATGTSLAAADTVRVTGTKAAMAWDGRLAIIPEPTSMRAVPGQAFTLTPHTTVTLASADEEVRDAATALTDVLRPSTGYPLPVLCVAEGPGTDTIRLELISSDAVRGEGYDLDATHDIITLRAHTGAGLFYGVQTLRQLLPPEIESGTVQPGPWTVPSVHITDAPRFAWRGAMLDVARHFFGVDDVERYIDLLAQYKMNVLHLHLTDDQGWRIQIDSWPRLATYGGSTQVGGGPGGYYTKADYAELVGYAQRRHITVVPEIDLPGHTNAALASYPELNCTGQSPPLYTGVGVGFSSLCVDKPITYTFVNNVVGELAAMTPGPFIHVGGDESYATPPTAYGGFIDRIRDIVSAHCKRMIGWEEISDADPSPSSIAQYWWDARQARVAVAKGLPLVMSPARKAYLDMKYDENTPLGVSWAGYLSVRDSYEWDPGTVIDGVPESAVLGPEAPLWSETLEDIDDVEYMAFPRLAGIAELGWSPAHDRFWDEYKHRLGAQAPRWDAQSVHFYRSPDVPWIAATAGSATTADRPSESTGWWSRSSAGAGRPPPARGPSASRSRSPRRAISGSPRQKSQAGRRRSRRPR